MDQFELRCASKEPKQSRVKKVELFLDRQGPRMQERLALRDDVEIINGAPEEEIRSKESCCYQASRIMHQVLREED